MAALVKNPDDIRLGLAGMVDENGHPYSWSAIINGFDPVALRARVDYPMIFNYLSAQPRDQFRIPGVRITHVWCDDRVDADHLARASLIPHVVNRPEEMIGQVDAVLIPTDKGWEHVERARPFVQANLPVYLDKPMADREQDLLQFVQWHRNGKAILSTSMMRYATEYAACRARLYELGTLRLIILTMAKSWERYGIHALEGVYSFLEPKKWEWVANTGSAHANMVHLHHGSGVDVLLPVVEDMFGGFGHLNLYGTASSLAARFTDGSRFAAFKRQLLDFVEYLRTGTSPVPFDDMVEIVKMVIAAIRSREQSGRRILLNQIARD